MSNQPNHDFWDHSIQSLNQFPFPKHNFYSLLHTHYSIPLAIVPPYHTLSSTNHDLIRTLYFDNVAIAFPASFSIGFSLLKFDCDLLLGLLVALGIHAFFRGLTDLGSIS
jgi:hypothetical protein